MPWFLFSSACLLTSMDMDMFGLCMACVWLLRGGGYSLASLSSLGMADIRFFSGFGSTYHSTSLHASNGWLWVTRTKETSCGGRLLCVKSRSKRINTH